VWVTDFGLTRLPRHERDSILTDEQAVALRYVSPEQLRHGRGRTDARSDVYALGLTLYELLTLQPAHPGRDRDELCTSILRRTPVPIRRLNPLVSRDLETVVHKAIDKDPSARYASAREFAADLRRFLADQPVRARRTSVVQRFAVWSSRHRASTVTAASALIFSLAAASVLLWNENRRADASLDELSRLELRERAALDNALTTIDQMTLALMENRQSAQPIPSFHGSPRAVLHPIAFAQVSSTIHTEIDEARLPLIAHALRRAGRSRLIVRDERGHDGFRRAIRIYEELVVRFPGRSELRLALIDTLHEFAAILDDPAHAAESSEAIHRALELARTISAAQ
jgi:serine/threonine protein kinase